MSGRKIFKLSLATLDEEDSEVIAADSSSDQEAEEVPTRELESFQSINLASSSESENEENSENEDEEGEEEEGEYPSSDSVPPYEENDDFLDDLADLESDTSIEAVYNDHQEIIAVGQNQPDAESSDNDSGPIPCMADNFFYSFLCMNLLLDEYQNMLMEESDDEDFWE